MQKTIFVDSENFIQKCCHDSTKVTEYVDDGPSA